MIKENSLFIQYPVKGSFQPQAGKIVYRYWRGDSAHVLIYLHGVQSHSGWFVQSGQAFSERGFSVYAPDRRGSGMSGFPVGDVRQYQQYLKDLESFIYYVHKQEPGKSIHLVGLCWGARLVLPIALKMKDIVKSIVLLSPGLVSKVDYSFSEKIQIAFAYLFRLNKQFHLPLSDEYFTENPKYLEFIKKDLLGLRQVTARFLIETVKLNRLALKTLSKISQPVYLLLAEKDKIVETAKTAALFKKKVKNLDIKTYRNWCHTLEFEPHAAEFYDDVKQWVFNKEFKLGSE